MKKVFIISFIFSFHSFLFSAVSDLTVEGVVVSYDKKSVVLAQDNGNRVRVSRSSISKYYKLTTGARVQAILSSKKLVELLRKQEEAKKQKSSKRSQL